MKSGILKAGNASIWIASRVEEVVLEGLMLFLLLCTMGQAPHLKVVKTGEFRVSCILCWNRACQVRI